MTDITHEIQWSVVTDLGRHYFHNEDDARTSADLVGGRVECRTTSEWVSA